MPNEESNFDMRRDYTSTLVLIEDAAEIESISSILFFMTGESMMSRLKDPYDFLKWEPHQKLTEEVDNTHVRYSSTERGQILHKVHYLSNKCVPYIYHIMTLIVFVALLVAGLSRIFTR